jgi:hypothetical protein
VTIVAPANYEFRIRGRVSEPVLTSFEPLESTTEPVETILHGPVRDQSELHGILDRLQSLGLELVEVRKLPG